MPTASGTSGADTLFGSSLLDVISGRGGDDQIFGFGGDDQLLGGGGADSLGGGDGEDSLLGGGGADLLSGGRGADQIDGGAGIDAVSYMGSAGGVSVDLSTGVAFGGDADGDQFLNVENVVGTSFDDFLTGDDGANVLTGGAGEDVLDGGHGDDVIDGGEGQDRIDGGGDRDAVTYRGSTEGVGVNLALNSGGGGDVLISIEDVEGSEFADFLYGDGQDNRLQGLDGVDRLRGHGGDDQLDGGAGEDSLLGGSGADVLSGGAGSDVVNGESGVDTASYAGSIGGVFVSLNPLDGAGEGGDAEGDRLFNIENLTGSAFADFLAGSAGANVLTGGGGEDFLIGDTGDDRFVWNAKGEGGDSIADFSNFAGNNDVLVFEGDAFGGLAAGALDPRLFVANASGEATKAAHRFVYDTDSGVLSFDTNGSADGGVTPIVQLAGAPALSAADFLIA